MISAQGMNTVREAKSAVYGLAGVVKNSLSIQRLLKRRGESETHVVLLSLGGRMGSPFLAKVLRDRGYIIHVISLKFPGYELLHVDHWHRADCLGDYRRILEICEDIKPHGVFSEARNVLIPIKAKLLQDLGLRGYGELSPATSASKIEFRSSLDSAGVQNIEWQRMENLASNPMEYPFVVKPDRGTGSRGVFFVENSNELNEVTEILATDKLESTTVGGEMIVEQYITGRQFDVEGVSRDGKPSVLSLTEERYEQVGKAFPSLWYLFSPPIDTDMRDAVLQCAKNTVVAAGVMNGAWHCEVRVDANGVVYPIDYSNRMGYPKMVAEASGIDFLGAYVDSLVSDNFVEPKPVSRTVFQRFIKTPEEKARFVKLASENSDNIIEFRRAPNLVAGVDRFGRVSIRAESFASLVILLKKYDVLPEQWSDLYEIY